MKFTRGLLLAGGLGLGACSASAPVVDVQTHVGPRHTRPDPQARAELALTVVDSIVSERLAWVRDTTDTAASSTPAHPLHPPTDAAQMQQLVDAVRSAPLDEIGGPARRLAAAGVEVWPQIRQALQAERTAPKGDYRSLLAAIGGDVPNRYGHFALAWKKAHGHAVKLSDDWFEDLLQLPAARVSSGLRPVFRDCIVQTALLRAAASIGADEPRVTGDVIQTLLDVAYAHQGIFRDEVGRAVVRVGDHGVPYLVVESMTPPGPPPRHPREHRPTMRAAYAEVQLDKMDRLHPQRATAAVRDEPRLLIKLIDAYATARPGEAAEVLLDLVDAADPSVRSSARAALIAYVNGAPPPVQGRTIRLLGGGTGRAQSHLHYRQRAALAIRARLASEQAQLLEPKCELQRADGSIDHACEQQPERLIEAYFGWLDEGRHQRDQTALDTALAQSDVLERIAQLNRLLASRPSLAVGQHLAPVFRDAAEVALEHNDPVSAGRLFRKAARLTETHDPSAGQTLRVHALLAEAAVPGLSRAGRTMLIDSARQIAPNDPRIAAAHARLPPRADELGSSSGHWRPVLGMMAGLWGLGLFGTWWRRRR